MRASPNLPFFILSLWQSKWLYGVWAALVLLAGVVAIMAWSQEKLAPLTLSPYQSYQCQTVGYKENGNDLANRSDKPVYRILTVLYKHAEELANSLCESKVMQRYYSAVEIRWMKRSQLSARQIVEEEFDLLWSRDRKLQGVVPNFSQYYEPLLKLPDYKVFWFSRDDGFKASAEYFRGKHIGLLEDMQSNSHFLLPLNHLKTLGVDLSEVTITYYTNYFMLENAFQRGEIDVISDSEWLRETPEGKTLSRELIDAQSSMGNWYVRTNRHNETDCEVLSALKAFTDSLIHVSLQSSGRTDRQTADTDRQTTDTDRQNTDSQTTASGECQ